MMEKEWLVGNPSLEAQVMSPIAERIAERQPELLEPLRQLRANLGDEKYAKYIDTLQNIAMNATSVLIRATNVMDRSMLAHECMPALKEAFAGKVIRIIG